MGRRRNRNFRSVLQDLLEDIRIYDPADGMDINRLFYGHRISREKYKFSQFEGEHVYMDHADGSFGRQVSIMHFVRRINRYKTTTINSDKGKINRRA